MSYSLTEDEIEDITNMFASLMLIEYSKGNCPRPFTMEDEYGNIYTMTVDVKLETPQ